MVPSVHAGNSELFYRANRPPGRKLEIRLLGEQLDARTPRYCSAGYRRGRLRNVDSRIRRAANSIGVATDPARITLDRLSACFLSFSAYRVTRNVYHVKKKRLPYRLFIEKI